MLGQGAVFLGNKIPEGNLTFFLVEYQFGDLDSKDCIAAGEFVPG